MVQSVVYRVIASLVCCVSLIPAAGCRSISWRAAEKCVCGTPGCTGCASHSYYGHDEQCAAALASVPHCDLSDSYVAGFRDGFADYMNAQARHDWSAGFYQGFESARQRVRGDALACTECENPSSMDRFEPGSIWEDQPQPTPSNRSKARPQRVDERMPAADAEPTPQIFNTDPPPMPTTPLDSPTPAEVPPSDEGQADPFADDPEPERASPPVDAEPEPRPTEPADDTGELNFDDLFVDPDETSDSRRLPAAALRGLSQHDPNSSEEAPQLMLRFRDRDEANSDEEVRQVAGTAEHQPSAAGSTTASDDPDHGHKSPQRRYSEMFQHPEARPAPNPSPGHTAWDHRFRVNQTQPVIFDDPMKADER